jgi:hypothetical protein
MLNLKTFLNSFTLFIDNPEKNIDEMEYKDAYDEEETPISNYYNNPMNSSYKELPSPVKEYPDFETEPMEIIPISPKKSAITYGTAKTRFSYPSEFRNFTKMSREELIPLVQNYDGFNDEDKEYILSATNKTNMVKNIRNVFKTTAPTPTAIASEYEEIQSEPELEEEEYEQSEGGSLFPDKYKFKKNLVALTNNLLQLNSEFENEVLPVIGSLSNDEIHKLSALRTRLIDELNYFITSALKDSHQIQFLYDKSYEQFRVQMIELLNNLKKTQPV